MFWETDVWRESASESVMSILKAFSFGNEWNYNLLTFVEIIKIERGLEHFS